jgi:hypothetical protein
MRPNVALVALDAPNVAFGAPDAPNVAFGALDAPNVAFGALNAPNVAFGALDAPNAAFGALNAPNVAFGALDLDPPVGACRKGLSWHWEGGKSLSLYRMRGKRRSAHRRHPAGACPTGRIRMAEGAADHHCAGGSRLPMS